MKKILLLFTALGALTLSSCTNDDDNRVDNDTIAENFEVTNVNFPLNGTSSAITIPLNPTIFTSDMVLVYRLTETDPDNGNDVWKLVPLTYGFNDGSSLSYDFDFSIDKVVVYLNGDFNLSTYPASYTQGQVFRVLIVPASFSKSATVTDRSYNTVVKKYGIDESKIKTIKL